MGGESAAGWIVKAIKGDDVPLDQRRYYNPETVFSRGSANICTMQSACSGWYWYHRDKAKCRAVLKAWRGYLDLKRWFTSEPWASHRYGTWINMSYEAVYRLAVLMGDEIVADGLRRYIRFEMFSTILTMGWISKPGYGFSYARGGSRSWCGWDGPNGKGTGPPYAHLIEEAAIGRNVNNWFGRAAEANWELEPILKALAKHNAKRWSYLSMDERALCLRLVSVSTPLQPGSVRDLDALLAKIAECSVSAHSTVHFIKTTKGTGWIVEKTHGSGSTGFMVGKVWYAGQRDANENRQVWADDYDKHFAPIFEGNKARRADPGGFGSVTRDIEYVFKAWTGTGKCANGYVPGAGKHSDGRHNPRDPDGWRSGPQIVTLGGQRIWHIKMTGPTKRIEKIYPTGGTGPPPPPPPPGPIDMLEVLAPSSVDFAKTRSGGGRMSTIRDDANRIFVLVKGGGGKAWDWYYWDDDFIYHCITEDGDKDDPTAFKTHVAPGVIWCRRFATLGKAHISSPDIHQWRSCEQGPVHSLPAASTKLHDRAYTAGELGMASNDVPSSTVCYRLDWRWGPNIDHLETFTYAVGWGHLDWDLSGHDVRPFNQRSPKPRDQPDFPCFNVPDWVDENLRPSPPPPPPPPPGGGGWHTIFTEKGYLKFNTATAEKALAEINAGKNHLTITQIALEPRELAKVKVELQKIVGES